MNRPTLNALLLMALLTPVLSCRVQGRPAQGTQKVQVELVSKYERSTLFDVSPDGSLVLLYGANTPTKEVKSGGVTEWGLKRGEEYFDMLRVVEWASGRELASIHLHTVPSAARFAGGAGQVCYREAKENRSWDYTSGRLSACPTEPKQEAYRGSGQKYGSPDGRFVAEPSKETVREILLLTYVRGVVTIRDRSTGEEMGAALHPTVREPYDWPLTGFVYSVAFTPDNRRLITSYEHDTFIWRVKPKG